LAATVIIGVAFVPKGALQLLTGRRWVDNPHWVRIVALVLGIPGFIAGAYAALGYAFYLIFND
jgi:uncharacterized membrane protein HdeD (DUF308 family)